MDTTVHDFSGFLPEFSIAGLRLPTYFLVVSAALCICIVFLIHRTEAARRDRKIAIDLALVGMIAGFIGSRLFHIVFEEPSYYAEDPWRVLMIWRGGFVWYGGAILGILAGLGFARWRRLVLRPWLDVFAPVFALGYALGRVACWMTGCCYGDVCELVSSYHFRHPTQIYAIVWELVVLAGLLRLERAQAKWLAAGDLFLLWLALHALGRVMMEAFRADPRGPAVGGLTISTWISLVLFFGCMTLAKRAGRFARKV